VRVELYNGPFGAIQQPPHRPRPFTVLPPLPIMFDRATGKEMSVNDQYDDWNTLDGPQVSSPTNQPAVTPDPNELWEQAKLARDRGGPQKGRWTIT